jgi:prepilin-type N-terminal cleavage/methylation domain-containing protein
MMFLAKACNKKLRHVDAFSLIEVLVVLAIIGILLTMTNSPKLISLFPTKMDTLEQDIQDKIMSELMKQSLAPKEKVKSFTLSPPCNNTTIRIGAGGLVEALLFECKSLQFRVNEAGGVLRYEAE